MGPSLAGGWAATRCSARLSPALHIVEATADDGGAGSPSMLVSRDSPPATDKRLESPSKMGIRRFNERRRGAPDSFALHLNLMAGDGTYASVWELHVYRHGSIFRSSLVALGLVDYRAQNLRTALFIRWGRLKANNGEKFPNWPPRLNQVI